MEEKLKQRKTNMGNKTKQIEIMKKSYKNVQKKLIDDNYNR